MFRVSMPSGEELSTISEEELGAERTVNSLKYCLREHYGYPVCLQSLLHASMKSRGNLELESAMELQLLLLSVPGADPSEVAKQLLDAAGGGRLQVLRWLVEAGVDKDLCTAEGKYETALVRASEMGHVETVRWLLDAGAGMDLFGVDNQTALIKAAHEAQVEVVRLRAVGGWSQHRLARSRTPNSAFLCMRSWRCRNRTLAIVSWRQFGRIQVG